MWIYLTPMMYSGPSTRFRPDLDLILIPGVRCHPGDPTEKQFMMRPYGTMVSLIRQFTIAQVYIISRTDSIVLNTPM